MTKRTDMLGSTMRSIIAPILRECPPECGIVSIVGIKVSEDTTYADVTISAFTEPKKALEFLDRKKGQLQKKLGEEMQRYRIPKLRFRLEQGAEGVSRVEKLLEELGNDT
jgi:ribosome-binding factor A